MKTQSSLPVTAFVAAALLSSTLAFGEGIPEPGLVMYGVVNNTFGGPPVRVIAGTLTWIIQPAGGGAAVTLTTPLQDISGPGGARYSYVQRVPFETLAGSATLSPNTLKLNATVTSYARVQVSIDGVTATIVPPALTTFTFSASDRGRVERVDLSLNFNPDTDGDGLPDAWERRYFGGLGRNGSGDFDGDGISDRDELAAGTDPSDPLLKFTNLTFDPLNPQSARVTVEWLGNSNKVYRIWQTTNLIDYTILQENLAGRWGTNSFGTNLPSTARFFRVQQQ